MILLMLGYNDKPHLLVEVNSFYNPDDFTFNVINGAWRGRVVNGMLYVENETEVSHKITIMSDDQAKLKGDYNDVFNRFEDNE